MNRNLEPKTVIQRQSFDIRYVRTPLFDMNGDISVYNVNITIDNVSVGSFQYYFSGTQGIAIAKYLDNTSIIHLLRSTLSWDMGGMEYRIVKDNFVEHFKNEVI